MRQQFQAARRAKKEIYHYYHKQIVRAEQDRAAAAQRSNDLRGLIRQSVRKSPIAGVVTAVRASGGSWAERAVPLVRVDDPRDYRVVLLLRQERAEKIALGAPLKLDRGAAVVEKKVPGWDRELFFTWVVAKPDPVEGLEPGARLTAIVPPIRRGKVGAVP